VSQTISTAVGTLRIPVWSPPRSIPKRSLRILPSACLGRPTGAHLGRGADSRALTQWRLKLHRPEQSGWNADNPFYWRFVLRGGKVPPDTEEHAAAFYERGEYELEEAVFRLLVDCSDRYAEGSIILGTSHSGGASSMRRLATFRKPSSSGESCSSSGSERSGTGATFD